MKFLLFCLLSIFLISSFNCLVFKSDIENFNLDNEIYNDINFEEANKAHYFTDYLKENNIKDAKLKALVNLTNDANFKSYSGYFTIKKNQCNNNLFSWFFENKNPNAPILLWLQGGPGASSLLGLFCEIGPFYIDKDLNLNMREHAWTKNYSVLFIDNPVGTGFSYTDKDECYARNQYDVSNDLYDLLKQFFTIFKHLKKNPFYITGESYAGKYVPSLAYKIHVNIKQATEYFNFTGIAIGNAWVDPVNQLDYATLLRQLGMIDQNQFLEMEKKKNEAIIYIRQQSWLKAFISINELIDGDLGIASLYKKFTGLNNYLNFLVTDNPLELSYHQKYLEQPLIKQKIHVGNHSYNDGSKVETYLREDVAKSVVQKLVKIIENYKTLIYNGQLDIIVAPILTENYLYKLPWSFKNQFLNAPRKIWKVNEKDTEVAGYIKSYRNLSYVVVRGAGHISPYDKPIPAYDLITKFIDNKLN